MGWKLGYQILAGIQTRFDGDSDQVDLEVVGHGGILGTI